MTKEVFKPVMGYGGAYEVSNKGNVRSVTRTIVRGNGRKQTLKSQPIKKRQDAKGYVRVYLNDKGTTKFVSVHRLVAKAFLDNPYNKPQINHRDGVKTNNCVDNLEWCTNMENQAHAKQHNLYKRSEKCGRMPIPVAMIDPLTGERVATFKSMSEAAQKTKIFAPNIRKVTLGMRHTAGGWKWKVVM